MSDSNGAGLAAVGCAPLVLLAFVLMIPVLLTGEEVSCTTVTSGSGVEIDESQIPDGHIATYSGEQLVNAVHIINVGVDLDLSRRDQTIGVMTAMGESSLRVLDQGDDVGPDSRGLFQQRDNGAWGTYEDRMDPTISATMFFEALMEVEDRDDMKPTMVAHAVQSNADPHHYTPYWQSANEVHEGLSGVEMPGLDEDYDSPECTPVGSGGDPQISGECPDIADPNLEDSPCRGHSAITAEFGDPWLSVGCYNPRPWEDPPMDHPKGLACDYMVANEDTGLRPTDELDAEAIKLSNWLIAHQEKLNVSYIIYDRHIWDHRSGDQPGAWEDVARHSDSFDTGNLTQDHVDHVHVSYYP